MLKFVFKMLKFVFKVIFAALCITNWLFSDKNG